MNCDQIRFTCGKLGFSEKRVRACESVILSGISAYSAEGIHKLPKGTVSRDVIKCSKKWHELLSDAKAVNDLLTSVKHYHVTKKHREKTNNKSN